MLTYVDANISQPEWDCLTVTPEMRANLISLQYQHQLKALISIVICS